MIHFICAEKYMINLYFSCHKHATTNPMRSIKNTSNLEIKAKKLIVQNNPII